MEPGIYPFTADTGVTWNFHLQKLENGRYRWFLVVGETYGPSTQYQFGDRPPSKEEALEWMKREDVRPLDF